MLGCIGKDRVGLFCRKGPRQVIEDMYVPKVPLGKRALLFRESLDVGVMSELRTDWLTGRAVLVAENRAERPNEFDAYSLGDATPAGEAASAAGQYRAESCPFCPGNEWDTPPALYELFDKRNRWRLRVIPNKYPAVSEPRVVDDTSGSREEQGCAPHGSKSDAGFGVHEVIVETARHVDRTSSLSESELRHVLEAYAARLRHWSADDRLAYGLVFKNQGARAGASLAHLHSQLIALPAVPAAVEAELRRANEAHAGQHSCAYCRLIQHERNAGTRVVHDGDGYFVFCPFAGLQPCEAWIMPSNHEPSYERARSDDSMARLAKVLRAVVVGIETLVPSASFNMLIRTAPWGAKSDAAFHWRIELQPRMNAIAGLESATGIYINPVAPERAAAELRGKL